MFIASKYYHFSAGDINFMGGLNYPVIPIFHSGVDLAPLIL